ncbi:hypothetical protein F2Q68_00016171 [Brassica cretica]|uniref:Uncharacterized protein n=1 Tax=Brassica cretica TaxID=69181 RepID=A0A8S9HF28_BRACR|nr:hypothetical protein F2Q68_00016171 [Brassica cretica]
MISVSHIFDFIYSEENGDFEIPTTHVKQPDIQVHHADESKQKGELKREKLVNHDTVEDDEYYVSGEQSKVDEADTKDLTSASIDSSNLESIDIHTSETIDTNIYHRSIPSTIPDATTVIEEVDISDMSSEPIDTPTTTSIDIPTVTSIDPSLQTSIDTNSCCRSIPLEIPEKSSCPQDIADSTLKSINVSSCYPDQKVEKEITMEDFLELEEFLELEGWQQLGDLDSSEEVTMEDFLELEEWLGDLDQNPKQKFDDQHTSGRGLKISPKADDIDRDQPDEIDRHPPYDIDLQSPSNIDQHTPDCIDRHPPNCIARYPCLDELSGYPIEPGPIEVIMHMSKTSHIHVPEHLRPPICAEEAVWIFKRVKRIHDPVKIMVPCAVFEVESPIPPDKGVYLSSYIEVLNDQHHVEAYQRGLRFREEVDECPAGAPSSDISKSELIDTNTSSSIDTDQIPSIDTKRKSEQNGYELCGNIFYGDTTTHSDKSGGKKWRNWKKKKRINEGSQISLIPHFSDDARKSRVRLHKSVGKKGRNWRKRKRTTGVEVADISDTSSSSIDTLTITLIVAPTSSSIDPSTSKMIDTDFCHRSIPLEIPEISNCPQDIANSTQESIDESSYDLTSDVDKVTLKDFLELEEWLRQKLDDQRASGKGLENSLKADDIDRHKPDEIDRHPPYDIDLQSPSNINQHIPDCIARYPPDCIKRHPCLDKLSGYMIKPELVGRKEHTSGASHLAVP